MKAKKIVKLTDKQEFIAAIEGQKSFIHRIADGWQKICRLMLKGTDNKKE